MGRGGASADEWQAHKAFVFDVGNAFLSSYLPLVHANVDRPFTAQEREWQLHRRGRYVEFNLVWDRGTRLGLVSNGCWSHKPRVLALTGPWANCG